MLFQGRKEVDLNLDPPSRSLQPICGAMQCLGLKKGLVRVRHKKTCIHIQKQLDEHADSWVTDNCGRSETLWQATQRSGGSKYLSSLPHSYRLWGPLNSGPTGRRSFTRAPGPHIFSLTPNAISHSTDTVKTTVYSMLRWFKLIRHLNKKASIFKKQLYIGRARNVLRTTDYLHTQKASYMPHYDF